MTTWKTNLIFENKINNKTASIIFKYSPLYTYTKLHNNLNILFKRIGWDISDNTSVSFKLLSYRDEPLDIIDWNKFILNRDKIKITIYDPTVFYYGLYTERGDRLMLSKNIKRIYSDIKMELVTMTLLIYLVSESGVRIKLIDVIDKGEIYYNKVATRLVKKYYEPYKINI